LESGEGEDHTHPLLEHLARLIRDEHLGSGEEEEAPPPLPSAGRVQHLHRRLPIAALPFKKQIPKPHDLLPAFPHRLQRPRHALIKRTSPRGTSLCTQTLCSPPPSGRRPAFPSTSQARYAGQKMSRPK